MATVTGRVRLDSSQFAAYDEMQVAFQCRLIHWGDPILLLGTLSSRGTDDWTFSQEITPLFSGHWGLILEGYPFVSGDPDIGPFSLRHSSTHVIYETRHDNVQPPWMLDNEGADLMLDSWNVSGIG